MPTPLSAGILLFRRQGRETEVLLIHPGGPYWARKDAGAWMIPKGGVDEGERAEAAALREFEEELGTPLASTPFPLCRVKQSGGKLVEARLVVACGCPAVRTILSVPQQPCSQRKAISILSICAAPNSKWNGRRGRARCAGTPRRTGRNG